MSNASFITGDHKLSDFWRFVKDATEQWYLGLAAYTQHTCSPLAQISIGRIASTDSGVYITTPPLQLETVVSWCKKEGIKINDRFQCMKFLLKSVNHGKIFLPPSVLHPKVGTFSCHFPSPFGDDFPEQLEFSRNLGATTIAPVVVALFLCAMAKYAPTATLPPVPEFPIIRSMDKYGGDESVVKGRVAILVETRDRCSGIPQKVSLTVVNDYHNKANIDEQDIMARCFVIPFSSSSDQQVN